MTTESSYPIIIGIDQLTIRCIIGVNHPERIKEQDIIVDLKVKTHFPSHSKDQLDETINYEMLALTCSQIAQTGQYQLIETYALQVVDTILRDFNVQWAWIKVKKTQAIKSALNTFVEFERAV
jgi:dihydroneopterin aldolase